MKMPLKISRMVIILAAILFGITLLLFSITSYPAGSSILREVLVQNTPPKL